MNGKGSIGIIREVLLIEISRYCAFADCGQETLVGLTKKEAAGYEGFTCQVCERWNDDRLEEKDIPEWWQEITTGQELVN